MSFCLFTHAGLDQLCVRDEVAVSTPYYICQDGISSVLSVSDEGGNILQRYRYSAFGEQQVLDANFNPVAEAPLIPFAYTGREWEPEVGMYFYRARFYDPVLGRFISRDPIGLSGGDVNLYAYVGNTPILFVDPTGQFFQIPAVVAAAAAYVGGNALIGGGIGAVTGFVTGVTTSSSDSFVGVLGDGLKSGFSGGVGGAVGAGISAVGDLTPSGISHGIDYAAGYTASSVSSAISNAFTPGEVSEDIAKIQEGIAHASGLTAAISPDGPMDALAIGISTGIFSNLVQQLAGVLDGEESANLMNVIPCL